MTIDPTTPTLPASYAVAEARAGAAQRQTRRLHAVELGALIVAAAAGVASWRVGGAHLDLLAAVTTVAFLTAIGASWYRDHTHPQADWVQSRAVAESIKSATWRYAVAGDPFPLGDQGAAAAFLDHVQAAVKAGADLRWPVDAEHRTELTDWMDTTRTSALAERKEAYRTGRLDDQYDFYVRRAGQNNRSRRFWFAAGILANLVGLAGGGLRFLDLVDIDVVGVAAALAGAAVAWTQLLQHRTLAAAYALTAGQLRVARARLPLVTEPGWADYVDSIEDLLEREHLVWLTSRASRGVKGR